MSGRPWVVAAVVFLSLSAQRVEAQQRREREPNSVYAERRAKLASQVDAPIILWGFTGREEISQDYVFAQEDRKSTRLNSSHSQISYAVFCLKKKKKQYRATCSRHHHPSDS